MIGGCVVPMVTPMKRKGAEYEVDQNKISDLTRKIEEEGAGGIFILGNAGGFQNLSLQMKKQVIDACAGRRNLLVGVSDKNGDEFVQLVQYAQEKGAAALVVLPEYQPSWDEVFLAGSLPVMLYNNPAICEGKSLKPEEVKVIINKYPGRVAGIKESSGNRELFLDFVKLQEEEKVPVFQGDALNLVWAKELEGKVTGFKLAGAVPVHANARACDYVGFLKNPTEYREVITGYAQKFDTIRKTLEEMVVRGVVDEATLEYWDVNHTNI